MWAPEIVCWAVGGERFYPFMRLTGLLFTTSTIFLLSLSASLHPALALLQPEDRRSLTQSVGPCSPGRPLRGFAPSWNEDYTQEWGQELRGKERKAMRKIVIIFYPYYA